MGKHGKSKAWEKRGQFLGAVRGGAGWGGAAGRRREPPPIELSRADQERKGLRGAVWSGANRPAHWRVEVGPREKSPRIGLGEGFTLGRYQQSEAAEAGGGCGTTGWARGEVAREWPRRGWAGAAVAAAAGGGESGVERPLPGGGGGGRGRAAPHGAGGHGAGLGPGRWAASGRGRARDPRLRRCGRESAGQHAGWARCVPRAGRGLPGGGAPPRVCASVPPAVPSGSRVPDGERPGSSAPPRTLRGGLLRTVAAEGTRPRPAPLRPAWGAGFTWGFVRPSGVLLVTNPRPRTRSPEVTGPRAALVSRRTSVAAAWGGIARPWAHLVADKHEWPAGPRREAG